MMDSRRFSIRELLAYITVLSVAAAVWCLDDPGPLLAFPVLFLTGALLGGPIGLAMGGRKWFLPAAIIGSVVLFILLLIPAMYAAR